MTGRLAINLGNGKRVSMGAYVRGWKQALTLDPETRLAAGSVPGQWWVGTVGEALREFRYGMHDRINQRIPGYGQGRKWSHDWFMMMWRLSRDVNGKCVLRERQCPPELRARLAHRLYTEDDF